MSTLVDPETLFEQQSSVLLQKAQNRSGFSPSRSPTLSALADRVSALEERMNSCDSFYQLAAHANTSRERERRGQQQDILDYIRKLDRRVTALEESFATIPSTVQKAVDEEIQRALQNERLSTFAEESSTLLETKLGKLEETKTESNKQIYRAMRKLKREVQLIKATPPEDSRLDELQIQLQSLRKQQKQLFDFVGTLHLHSAHDFEGVNQKLSSLWDDLSKRIKA